MHGTEQRGRIYGYLFKVVCQRAENTWVAYCPGVGGVYEEGESHQSAIENAYSAARAILNARALNNDWLTEDGPDLRVLRQPPNPAAMASLRPSEEEYVATVP